MKKMNRISELKMLKIISFYLRIYKNFVLSKYKISIFFLKVKLSLFNNIILFQIEFKNLREIPEGIMYIPQLNGLFIAEKIMKTSKETIIVNCYKITTQ